jgi:hypothetical protein
MDREQDQAEHCKQGRLDGAGDARFLARPCRAVNAPHRPPMRPTGVKEVGSSAPLVKVGLNPQRVGVDRRRCLPPLVVFTKSDTGGEFASVGCHAIVEASSGRQRARFRASETRLGPRPAPTLNSPPVSNPRESQEVVARHVEGMPVISPQDEEHRTGACRRSGSRPND